MRATGMCISSASSSGVGSRPSSWVSCFCARQSLFMISIMCTGMRMVRAWSAMRARDGLANPPDGVGGELVAAAVLEFFHALHQADVAFLDQIQKRLAAVGVFLGHRHHQAQVGLRHVGLGLMRAVRRALQLPKVL